MRIPLPLALAASLAALSVPHRVVAQEGEPSNPWNDGLIPGNYVRVSAGTTQPVSPHAALRLWKSGTAVAVGWENWDTGASGVGRVGFSINAAYSVLKLDQGKFLDAFTTPTGGKATAVSSASAGVLEVTSGIRLRLPLPYVMPNLSIGLGLIDWTPGRIQYEATTGPGSVRQQQRVSGEFTLGAGIDKHIVDRYSVFAEALYVYGYTSYGSGFANPGGVCSTAGCDAFRNGNTTLGTVRGGLRVRVGR